MNQPNDWKQSLDKIFRSHESRIEQLLNEMSHTIETSTVAKDDDLTFMTILFDYIQLRLIATCKKIEVRFLERRAKPQLDLKSKRNSNNGKTDESTAFSNDCTNQLLKIVEDSDLNASDSTIEIDSSNDTDCLGSNETLVG